jgi:hypothetical protein
MAFLGAALSAVGKTAATVAENKVNKKLGTHFGSGTSKPTPAATSTSQTAPAPGMSARKQSAQSGTVNEYGQGVVNT